MIISYDGRDVDFDDTFMSVTAEEWREIKRKLNLTVRGVIFGMADVDADAVTATRWLLLRAAGQHDLVLDPAEEFSVVGFAAAWREAEEAQPGPEPDPTQAGSPPAGTTPQLTGSSTPTSEPSSASTSSPSPGTAESGSGKRDASLSAASSGM